MNKIIAYGLFLSLCLGIGGADDVVINNHRFPDDFKFGVATSAYQIEGAWNEEGKGEQMWDWFMHTYPNKTENGDNGDIACDSYHKWEDDIELLKDLAVKHYRLSIMWSRILPDGIANNRTINQAGVDYYRNFLQALVDANITPLVTLYHWDLPLHLHQLGGWLNPVIADHFAGYARICFGLFGDLVKNWITLNEAHSTCVYGYGTGFMAPSYRLPGDGIYQCAYTSLVAHAKAYRIYQNEFKEKQGGRVSIVIDSPWSEPRTNSTKDLEAVEREQAFFLGLYANPIYIGNWPQTVIDIVGKRSRIEGFASSRLPEFTGDEIELIKGTSDFFCLNTYATVKVAHQNNVDELIDLKNVTYYSDKGTYTYADASWPGDVDWVHLVPWGFRKLLNYVYNTYGNPEIIVTENGWADKTGTLNDTDRITYLNQYLSALLDAKFTDGVNVTGYTIWSLLDNLEWTHGYTQKLGITHVDFNSPNRTRTPKASYKWYKGVLKRLCLLDDVEDCVK